MRRPRSGPVPIAVVLMLVLAACTTTGSSEPSQTTAAPTPDQTGITSTTTTGGGRPGGPPTTGTVRGPLDARAEIRPDLITIDPARPRAGDLVSVFFPDERIRGIHFVLESRGADGWDLEYHLISDWGDGRDPKVYRADSVEGIGFEDVGINGAGPDVVLIPADVVPGDYRICTGNSRPNICSPLTVEPAA